MTNFEPQIPALCCKYCADAAADLAGSMLHFSWISSIESIKFVQVATEVIERVAVPGPAKRLVKTDLRVAS